MAKQFPLTEAQREQLDGIVAKMIENGESESDIQFVVNDFKSKYSKKKDATDSQSTGVQEVTTSDVLGESDPVKEYDRQIKEQAAAMAEAAPQVEIPNWMRNFKDKAPRREYEVKKTIPTKEERIEEAKMFTPSTEEVVYDEKGEQLYTKVSVDPEAVKATFKEQEAIREGLNKQGYSTILYDYDLTSNSRAEEAIRAAQKYEGIVEGQKEAVSAEEPIGRFGIPRTFTEKSEEEMQLAEKEAKIRMGNALGWDSEVAMSYSIEELKGYAIAKKEQSEANLFEATLEMAKEDEMKDPTKFGLTRTAFWDGFIKTPAANMAIIMADASGNYKLAEKIQQETSERRIRSQMSMGIDPTDTKGIYEEISEGNWSQAWKKGLLGAAESTGGLLLTITNPSAGISYFGGTSYASTYNQFRDRADLNTSEKQTLAFVAGATEIAVARVLGGVNNIRRFRSALGISDDIGKASLSAKNKAFNKVLNAIEPISESVSNTLKNSRVQGFGRFLLDTGEEAAEEGLVSFINQTAAAVIANDSYDPYEIYDSMILGGMMGAPMGAFTGAGVSSKLRLENAVYKRPLASDMAKYEELQKEYSEVKQDARREKNPERKAVLFDTAREIREEVNDLLAKASKTYDGLSEQDQERLAEVHKDIHKISKKIKGEENESVKKRTSNLLKQALAEKARIETGAKVKEITTAPVTGAVVEQAPEVVVPEGVALEEVIEDAKRRAEKDTPRGLENQRVRYFDPVLGELIEGTLIKDGQSLAVETDDKRILELGNFDELADTPLRQLRLSDAKEVIQINPDGSFTYNSVAGAAPQGTNMIPSVEGLKSIKRDKDGNIKRVVMKSLDGAETYNLTGQDAVDVAYQLHLQQLQTPESIAKVESELQKDENARRIIEAAEQRQAAEPVRAIDEVTEGRPAEGVEPTPIQRPTGRVEGIGLELKEETNSIVTRFSSVMSRIVPDLKVVLHASRESYNQTYEGASKSNGHYNPDTKTAHIIVDADTQLDELTTLELLKHEIIHPLLDVFLQNSAAETAIAADAVRSILKRLEGSRDAKKVLDHAAKYEKAGRSQDVVNLELVTEFFAVYSNPDSLVNARETSPSFLERVKDMLNRLLRVMGISDGKTQLESEADVRELLEKLTFAFSTGAAIRSSRQSNIDASRENSIKESLDRAGSPKDPYGDAITPERGLTPLEIYTDWIAGNSNFIIAEDFDHSLEIRRAGFVESHQRKDGSIVLVQPSAYEKTVIDGVIQISSKSFMSDKDITDKRQKKIAGTISSFAKEIDLPIAFVERPDLKFTSSIVYPDRVNGVEKPTMVVNLSFANARTGASAFSFAIVETLRKGVVTEEINRRGEKIEFTTAQFNEMIRTFEGEDVDKKIVISDKLKSIYLAYKDAFLFANRENDIVGEKEAQFHAISMTIQESIDKMITESIITRRNMDLFDFLSGIQEQITGFVNSKLKPEDRKVSAVPFGEDFLELVGLVFVDKKIPINLELTAEQKQKESDILDRLDAALNNTRQIEGVRDLMKRLSNLHRYVGDVFSPVSVLETVLPLLKDGKISKESFEEVLNRIFNSGYAYERFNMNLDLVDAYVDDMNQLIEDVVNVFYNKEVDFKRIYSDFSKWRADGFPSGAKITPAMELYKKYYDLYPKSEQDWKFNQGAVQYSDVTDMQAYEIYGEDFLSLGQIAEISGMPYNMIKASLETVRNMKSIDDAKDRFKRSFSPEFIAKETDALFFFESIADEAQEKVDSFKETKVESRSLNQIIKLFEERYDIESGVDLLRSELVESNLLDKEYEVEYTDENGVEKTGKITVELSITTNSSGRRFIDVAYENDINESAYSDNRKNQLNVMATMSKVFDFTQAIAQIFGADGIMYSAVQIGKGRISEETHAKNLVEKSKGFNTSWFRRGINSKMAISRGGLQARSQRAVAFYDPSYNAEYIYKTESTQILGVASSVFQSSFESKTLSEHLIKIKQETSKIEEYLYPTDKNVLKKTKTEAIPVEGMSDSEIADMVNDINSNSFVFYDSETVLNVEMQAQPFVTRSSVVSLSGIRESLSDIDVEDLGKEGAESLDTMQENSAKAVIEQSNSGFWKKIISRKSWIDRQTKLKKAMSRGFSRYVNALVVDRLGAGAYADRIFTKMRKEIYGKLDNSELQLLDNVIFAKRVIDIDRTWDERLSVNTTKLKNEMLQLASYEQELKQAKVVKDKKLIDEIKLDIKNSKKIISNLEAKVEKYSTRPLHPAPNGKKMNLEVAEATLKHYERTLPKELWEKISDRSDKYFDAYRQVLQMQFEAGLIDQETRDRFINNDYSPRRFLNKMFGGVDDVTFQQMGLEKEQIQSIREGSDTEIFTDTEFLLSISLRAVQNKKAKNLLFNEMYKEAQKKGFENISDGEFIKDGNYKKNRKGEPKTDDFGNYIYESEPRDSEYKHVFFKVDGKTRAFRINKRYYNDITGLKTTNMSPKVRKLLRWITGTQLVKMTATTINFWFSITGTTRGFREVTRGRDVYDKYRFLPFMQAVLFVDFVKGLRSAIADNALVEEYYEHGGGLSFMTTQGRPSKSYRNRNKFAIGFLQRRGITLNPLNALAYAGEKSELALRLAVYERVKKDLAKQYPDATESEIKYMAVKEAREIADFAQGGELSSEVDLVIPYFNAAIQGTRATYDYARKNPKKFAEKQVQAYMLNTALAVFARLFLWDDEEDKDYMENVSDFITERYNIIPTGLKDSNGEHIVLRIPKAHQFIFFDSLSEITAKEIVYSMKNKEVPKDLISDDGDLIFLLKSFESSLPAGQFLPFSDMAKGRGVVEATATRMIGAVPIASSAIAYWGNYDLFRQKVISWEAGQGMPLGVEGYKDKNVHDIYKFLGDVNRNISPRRMEVATEKLIGSESTLLTALLYQLTDKFLTVKEETEGVPIEKAKKGIENMYGFGKSIIYTIPKERIRIDKSVKNKILKEEALTENHKIKTNIRLIAKKYSLDDLIQMSNQTKALPKELNEYINGLDAPQSVKRNYVNYFRLVAKLGEVGEEKYKLVAFAETPKLAADYFISNFGRPEDLTAKERIEIETNFGILGFEFSQQTKDYIYGID